MPAHAPGPPHAGCGQWRASPRHGCIGLVPLGQLACPAFLRRHGSTDGLASGVRPMWRSDLLPTPGGPWISGASPWATQRQAARSRTCFGSSDGPRNALRRLGPSRKRRAFRRHRRPSRRRKLAPQGRHRPLRRPQARHPQLRRQLLAHDAGVAAVARWRPASRSARPANTPGRAGTQAGQEPGMTPSHPRPVVPHRLPGAAHLGPGRSAAWK